MIAPALILAVPSKGRLQEQTLAFFKDCGVPIAQDRGARGYVARMEGLPEIEVRLLSASEIAAALKAGDVHLGVTGEDLLRETAPDLAGLTLVMPLGFGRADLVLATPAAWLDVETMADFAAVCAERRARTGDRLRIATKYLALSRAFFAARGLVDYRLVESAGATEGAPASGAAEAIVDITTSGATLAANQLRPLRDGTILRSQAQLAAARGMDWTEQALAALGRLLDRIEARTRGRDATLLKVFGVQDRALALQALTERGCEILASSGDTIEASCARSQAAEAASAAAALAGRVAILEAEAIYARPVSAFEAARAALLSAPKT